MNILSTSAANIARFSDATSPTKGKQRAKNAPFRSPIGSGGEGSKMLLFILWLFLLAKHLRFDVRFGEHNGRISKVNR